MFCLWIEIKIRWKFQVLQEQRVHRVKTGPLPEIFLALTVMVDVEKTYNVVETAHFHFTDSDENIIVKAS